MNENTPIPGKRLQRSQFLQLLDAALVARSFRFGRQASLAWLAIYPGDLQVHLAQAKFLLGEGKTGQVLPMLDRLSRLDPEWPDVYRLIAQNTYGTDTQRYDQAVTSLVALKEGRPAGPAVKEWGPLVREARQVYERGAYDAAWSVLGTILENGDLSLVTQSLHLRLTAATKDAQALYKLAELYQSRSPDCLQFNLFLADALMHLGSEPEAVRLLHKSMAMDAAGQVATRIWGKEHPYRSIWPVELTLKFDLPVPAEVAARLGWTWFLPETSSLPAIVPVAPVQTLPPEDSTIPDLAPEEQILPDQAVNPMDIRSTDSGVRKNGRKNGQAEKSETVLPDNSIEAEFEKLARRLKKPSIGRSDGRYPVYVIFSCRKGLEKQYGPQTAAVMDAELRRLADAARRRTGWEAIVLYADDDRSTATQGLDPVVECDPWKLKLLIGDLDKSLAKKGLMIGMMLIVGGPQVVPFHELPNPTDDFDEKILSDNPYATTDSNYFVPEWPVGRLPGSNGPDAGPLLEQLRYIIAYHNRRGNFKGSKTLWAALRSVLSVFGRLFAGKQKPNFGYSAAVWRRSSLAVFRPVGNPHQVLISPPQVSTTVPVEKMMLPELCYYNLHGLSDTGEWYGQRDPGDPVNGPDYPIALTPKELRRNGHAPKVVFSEACYGGFVNNKNEDDSLTIKFLSLGTLAVVGSTCIAYGAINTPLVAADLLGNYFWQQIRGGRTVGEALMVAKIELVREMVKRQGFLDAEDQKTLLSFVLYGDPLVGLEVNMKRMKNLTRFKRHSAVKTIEEKPVDDKQNIPVSDKIINQVKEAVASCLPGVEGAQIFFSEEINEDPEPAERGEKTAMGTAASRYVVTLSKQNPSSRSIHRHYARATVQNGKIVKLVVSR